MIWGGKSPRSELFSVVIDKAIDGKPDSTTWVDVLHLYHLAKEKITETDLLDDDDDEKASDEAYRTVEKFEKRYGEPYKINEKVYKKAQSLFHFNEENNHGTDVENRYMIIYLYMQQKRLVIFNTISPQRPSMIELRNTKSACLIHRWYWKANAIPNLSIALRVATSITFTRVNKEVLTRVRMKSIMF